MFSTLIRRMHRGRAIEEAIERADPASIAGLLREDPEARSRVLAEYRYHASQMHYWCMLAIAAGLAEAADPAAAGYLRDLLDASHLTNPEGQRLVDWNHLPGAHRRLVFRYLAGQDTCLAQRFVACLDEEAVDALMPAVDATGEFLDFCRLLVAAGQGLSEAVDRLIGCFEQAVLQPDGSERSLLTSDRLTAMGRSLLELLWQQANGPAAVRLMTTMAIAQPSTLDPSWLRTLAGHLPALPPVSRIRVVALLASHPLPEWLPALMPVWAGIVTTIRHRDDRRDDQPVERTNHREIPDDLAVLANATAIAIGRCAAMDPAYVAIRSQAESTRLQQVLTERNGLVERYNDIFQRYQNDEPQADAEAQRDPIGTARLLEQRIRQLDVAYEQAEIDSLEHLCPATVLALALEDAQRMPPAIRQGAAWGIHRLIVDSHLAENDRQQLRQRLQAATREFDEAALRQELAAIVSPPDTTTGSDAPEPGSGQPSPLVDRLYDRCAVYLFDGNLPSFQHGLQIELDDPDRIDRVECLALRYANRQVPGDFRERVLHFLPQFDRLEWMNALRLGLAWVDDLEIDRNATDHQMLRDRFGDRGLAHSLSLLHELLPGAAQFLEQYPLRLMNLTEHHRLLGQFAGGRHRFEYWTRYLPPLWTPGATPAEAGKVIDRSIDLDDRSTPNSMGICHHVFCHPLLVLPIVYHEFLHYGGPHGNPSLGIGSELEVLLREILFTRSLVARLAPVSDSDLPAYESMVVELMRQAELEGMGYQLICDLADDDLLAELNASIVGIYGHQLSESEARHRVEIDVQRVNRQIDWTNLTDNQRLNWCPEIVWPHLDTPRTIQLSRHYRELLFAAYTRDHTLTPTRRDEILADPVCRKHLMDWEGYVNRRGALAEFRRAWTPALEDRLFLHQLMIRISRNTSADEETQSASDDPLQDPGLLLEYIRNCLIGDADSGDDHSRPEPASP